MDVRDRLAANMRHLMFLKAGALEFQEAPDPKIENARQALVRPLAVAACDLDSHIVAGRAPFRGPFALGHECIAEVVEIGEDVYSVSVGDRVSVPFQISCGSCAPCRAGHTGNCETAGPQSTFGFGRPRNPWGGMLADLVLVPFADAMLLRVPASIAPETLASLSDNIPDGWRAVAPFLTDPAKSSVLVVGGTVKSISLYAAAVALALGVPEVDYMDTDPLCLQKARLIGANAIEGLPEKPGRLYTHAVDASNTEAGLSFALRSVQMEGTCFSVAIYFQPPKVPLREMYVNGITLKTGRCHARPAMPQVLSLEQGRLKPELITSHVTKWDDAVPALLADNYSKLVISR
jgi:threonine dehydrogenase-like Zn-dependent dehydrogenase